MRFSLVQPTRHWLYFLMECSAAPMEGWPQQARVPVEWQWAYAPDWFYAGAMTNMDLPCRIGLIIGGCS